ncbi:MAG: transglycosylase domain-containing protein [Bacteroidetes bacterium]|nr:transglycosylase domain-containing protein [Bacteroidota bacterium]
MGFLFLVFIVPLYIYSVRINFMDLYGGLPSLKSLENPQSSLATVMYFADGVEMGKYFRENRNRVNYKELAPNLINALLATEDIRFEQHSGIDLISLIRVARGIISFNLAGGGSTLSQQLAKNLFRTRMDFDGKLGKSNRYLKLIIDKTKEWIVAVILERSYSKKEIISMYLNTVDFGSNSFGIKVAAETFFDQTPDSLNIQQSAMLVGLVQAPTRHSPILNPENALDRRNVVLRQMYKYNSIDQQQYDSIKQLPIELEYKVASHNVGPATYFRSVARNFLMRWSREHGYDLWADGLRIYTTIDSRMQAYAERAVTEHISQLQELFYEHLEGANPWINDKGEELENFIAFISKRTPVYKKLVAQYGDDTITIDKIMNTSKPLKVFSWKGEIDTVLSPLDSIRYYKHFLHAGFMAMDPNTGHIKAWVGGINHKYFKYDHVKQGRRQPGSTFKPFLYSAAIDNGYSPCFEVQDAPISFEAVGDQPAWSPSNSGRRFEGERMNVRQAMGRSMNRIAAYMIRKIGPKTVAQYGKRIGIQSYLAPVPSLCLGTSDVSLYEMVGAYSTFVNKGVWTEPFYITRIEDKNGNTLQSFVPKTREALNEEVAYLMIYMLRGATEEDGGTALGVGYDLLVNNEIGAKTGTTQNASDGWFMGVTKDLVAGAWVGGDDKPIHFKSWVMGQGARTAMPIWKKFMTAVYADPTLGVTKGPFKPPVKKLSVELDCTKYSNPFIAEGDSVLTDSLYIDELKEEEIL